jgi:hypothetical protein
MTSVIIDRLRIANGNLRVRLARLLPESATLEPQDLSGLLTDLLGAADCLRSVPRESVPHAELEKARCEYRSIVEQLGQTLPQVQGRLLTEKARLEIARAHVAATAAWAQASQKSL